MADLLHIAVSSSPGEPGRVPATDVLTSDLALSCDPNLTLVGDVAELVGFARGPLLIDGRTYPGSALLAETSIADGSVVANPADRTRPDVDESGPPVITVRTIAGAHGGRSQDLGAGRHQLTINGPLWVGAGEELQRGTRVALEVQTSGLTVHAGSEPVVVNGQLVNGLVELPSGESAVLNLGADRFVVSPYVEPLHRRAPIDGAVHRVPRVASPPPTHRYTPPDLPSPPNEAQPLSWIAMLAPVPVAVFMAMMIGQMRYLAFAAMSPLAMLARWYDGRRRAAKQAKEYADAVVAGKAQTLTQIMAARAEAVVHATANHPGPAEVVQRALGNDPRLWERRPGHDDFGVVTVAVGERPWRFEAKVPPEMEDIVASVAHLDSAPLTVDFREGSVGIVGPRNRTLGVARALLTELSVLSGPADVPLAVVGVESVLDDWDWAKWLPHLGSPGRLASTIDQTEAIVAKQTVEMPKRPGPEAPVHPVTVLLIDGTELLRRSDSPLRQALAANNGISGIVVADTEDQLPASCNWVIDVSDTGTATLTDMMSGQRAHHVTPAAMDVETASAAARALARLVDPDVSATSIDLPSFVSLPSVTGSTDASAVLSRWEGAGVDPNPVATLGIGPMGPFEVDLVKDGPHALLAGTTGAGKSEFLRSFVLSMATRFSPETVNFVLIDYKGGGAFDVCAELPHTVAMVTDLDGHLGARALRSLQAELRFREITFRSAGVHDLGGYRNGGGIMPRLVVVVDEFATLAAELPDFLDALVDIAQRGRSLGIHMVLATQRPAGVVDAKIKSNTNLRISLRVQDDADSQDVIGTNDAARLRRSEMGRGFVRMGAGDIVPLQSAYAGGVTPEVVARTGVTIEEYRLRRSGAAKPEDLSDQPSDMERMVTEIVLANDKAGLADPRKPWLPELPAQLALEELPEPADTGSVVIGLMDVPAEQRREPLSIGIGSGHTLLYGAEAPVTTATLTAAIVQGLRSRTADDLHVYVLDWGSAGLRALRTAPHVGAYVPHDDDDLLSRALDLLDRLMAERKAYRATGEPVSDLPAVLVAVDGFGSLIERLNDAGDHDTLARIGSIVREGAVLGLSVLATASTERQVPGRLAGQIGRKLLHRLADPAAVVSFGLRQKDVPTLTGSMVLDVETALDGVTASVDPEELQHVLEAMEPAAERRPARLRILGGEVRAADLEQGGRIDGNRLVLPIGVRIRDVETEVITIDVQAAILGGPQSGKTSTLLQLAQQALIAGLAGAITAVVEETSPIAGLEGVSVVAPDCAETDGLFDGARLVLVDDANRVGKPLGEALKTYASETGRGRWLVAAMKPADTKSMMEWTSVFRGGSVGLLLTPSPTDGDTLKVMLPAKVVAGLRPAQGILVHHGAMSAIQAAR